MRKGYTLVELAFTAVLLTILVALGIKSYLEKKDNEAINELAKNIVLSTKVYALDSQIGYLNGSGGYCSDDNTFNKIDAWRAINCAEFLNKPYLAYQGNSSKTNKDKCAYIIFPAVDIMGKKTDDGNVTACRMYYDYPDEKTLYVNIDCSYIQNKRKRALIEKLIDSDFKKLLPSVYDSTDFKWKQTSDCTGNSGGTSDDGELRVTLKIN